MLQPLCPVLSSVNVLLHFTENQTQREIVIVQRFFFDSSKDLMVILNLYCRSLNLLWNIVLMIKSLSKDDHYISLCCEMKHNITPALGFNWFQMLNWCLNLMFNLNISLIKQIHQWIQSVPPKLNEPLLLLQWELPKG